MRIVKASIEFFDPVTQTSPVWTGEVDLDNIVSAEGRHKFVMDTLFSIAFDWAGKHWSDHKDAKWEYMRQDGRQPDMVNIFDGGTWIGTFKLIIGQ